MANAKFVATFKDGTVLTRSTARTYGAAYMVIVDGKVYRTGFAITADAAAKATSMFANPSGKFGTLRDGKFVPFTQCVVSVEIVSAALVK
jgi:hypothetical protein